MHFLKMLEEAAVPNTTTIRAALIPANGANKHVASPADDDCTNLDTISTSLFFSMPSTVFLAH
jgi:hypothetical protein